MAKVAQDNGSYNSTAITTSNAFEILMKGVEYFGNHNVPMENTYCFAAYKYTGMLMRDNSFVRYSDSSQEMLKKGIIGKAAGIEIVQVPDASSGKSMISAGIVPSDEQLSAMGWTPQQYWVYKMSQASAAQ